MLTWNMNVPNSGGSDGTHSSSDDDYNNRVQKGWSGEMQAITGLAQGVRSIRESINKCKPLDPSFQPGPKDCICARGSRAYNHPGNANFRALVKSHMEEYNMARNKMQKSMIVSRIVDQVRRESPSGGFVRQDDKGTWCQVTDSIARERVGQVCRQLFDSRVCTTTSP